MMSLSPKSVRGLLQARLLTCGLQQGLVARDQAVRQSRAEQSRTELSTVWSVSLRACT